MRRKVAILAVLLVLVVATIADQSGPRYPTTYPTDGTVPPENDRNWETPENIVSDDGNYAEVTHATFDNNAVSYRILTQTYGFNVPSGSTINGIEVWIEHFCDAGSAVDYRVQLIGSGGTLVGDNYASTTAWGGSPEIFHYGGATDGWTPGEGGPTHDSGQGMLLHL